MPAKKKKPDTFEECFEALTNAVSALKNESLTLEESYNSYKTGMEHYEACQGMLREFKQKIEIYDRRLDELKEAE